MRAYEPDFSQWRYLDSEWIPNLSKDIIDIMDKMNRLGMHTTQSRNDTDFGYIGFVAPLEKVDVASSVLWKQIFALTRSEYAWFSPAISLQYIRYVDYGEWSFHIDTTARCIRKVSERTRVRNMKRAWDMWRKAIRAVGRTEEVKK